MSDEDKPIKEVITQPEVQGQITDKGTAQGHVHKPKHKTLGEKLMPWGTFLGMVVGGMFALYASFLKGEPKANQTWTVLRDQVNEQVSAINKIQLQVVMLQAREEGFSAANLQLKLDQLQAKYDSLLKQLKAPPPPKPVPRSPCKVGFRLSPLGVCKAVPTPTIDVMKKALEEERAKLEAERRQQEKMRQDIQKRLKGSGGSDKVLQALPPAPDDVPKK